MFKKVAISLVLTVCILAFPVRFLATNPYDAALLKSAKGILFIAILFIMMKRENIFTKKITRAVISRDILLQLLPALALLIGYIFIAGFSHLRSFEGSTSILLLTLLATLVAASGEEVIFRGFILNILRKGYKSLSRSLIISSVLFAFIHIVNVFKYDDIWGVCNQIIFAFALGMLLGSMYVLTNNLVFVCVFHFLINIPSAIRSLHQTNVTDIASMQSTLSDNLLSTLFIAILTLPFLALSFYYLRIASKRDAGLRENGELAVIKKGPSSLKNI